MARIWRPIRSIYQVIDGKYRLWLAGALPSSRCLAIIVFCDGATRMNAERHEKGRTYCRPNHDSLKIINRCIHWNLIVLMARERVAEGVMLGGESDLCMGYCLLNEADVSRCHV